MKGVGVIGIGGFGRFLLDAYSKMDDVRIAGISSRSDVSDVVEQYNIPFATDDYKALLQHSDIDIVVIATPPFLHAEMAIEALSAGKDVIIEKPLALTDEEAQRIRKAQERSGNIVSINFVLRPSPVTAAAKKLIEEKVLGDVISFRFENYASDAPLHRDHWFWDTSKSGGIWVEHGVHFFDLYRYLLGGEIIDSHAFVKRRDTAIEEVSGICNYGSHLGSFVHAFVMPDHHERCQGRIVCERGYIDINGWIPESLRVNGIVENMPEIDLVEEKRKEQDPAEVEGRWKTYSGRMVDLWWRAGKEKAELYQDALRDILRSVAAGEPQVTFEDGYAALREALLLTK